MILGIEFDQLLGYDTLEACLKWINNSQYWWVLKFKNFNLRKRKNGFWISGEKRQVFAWTGELWRYKSLKITRPEPGVVVVDDGIGEPGVFSPTELPPPLLETVHKNAEKEAKKRLRKEMSEKKKKEARETRGTVKKPKKQKEILPGVPAPPSKKQKKEIFKKPDPRDKPNSNEPFLLEQSEQSQVDEILSINLDPSQ